MVTSDTAGRLQLSASFHFYPERSCYKCLNRRKARYTHSCSLSLFAQQLSVGKSGYGKLACDCSSSSRAPLVLPVENFPGRIDTPVDAGIKVSNVEFNPDILDIRYRDNNRAAPPVVPFYPPSDENGPTELDFEIYASNSMANYEPPPPPRIPFSAPFEDYYGQAVGVDYISRQENSAHSLLRFLDSLNAKKVEDGGANTKKPLFASGSLHMAESAERNPFAPDYTAQTSAQGMNGGRGKQEKILSSSVKTMEQLLEQQQVTVSGTTHMDDTILSADSTTFETPVDLLSSSAVSTVESHDAEATLSEKPLDSPSSVRSTLFTSNKVIQEAQDKGSPQSGNHSEIKSSVTASSLTGLSDDMTNFPTPIFSQYESAQRVNRDLGQRGYVHAGVVTGSLENAEASEMRVEYMHKVVSADKGRECLNSTQALHGHKEASPMSQFYVPQEGDLVLGAITFMNDQKVDLEIGAELSALMRTRDLQPLLQNVSSMFFEISNEDDSGISFGESLLVKDGISNFPDNDMVEIGTVVIAEVIGKTIIDGRAILSCKASAQKLAWRRIDQLMRWGEAVQMKIMQWNEGGLLGQIEGTRAFLPRSELLQKLDNTALLRNYVGSTLSVAVIQTDRQRVNIIASEVQAWMSRNLQVGAVHDVTVTRVHTYGMQVEVDNTKIRGFVHKTNFSKEFVSSVANYFGEGDKARVMVIKGRDPTKVSFSLADLEKENGLLLRDKEQVFLNAEEMGRRFRERLLDHERKIFAVAASTTRFDYQEPEIANLAWLHSQNAAKNSRSNVPPY